MKTLEQIIIDTIKRRGPITFGTFMDMSLYYPRLGYYTSPESTIGRKGDFYTGSHLHSLFGTMIGKQLEEMWEVMGRPSVFHSVEIGAGAGYLCKDILTYLQKSETFHALQYIIVELNRETAENQRRLLSDFKENVRWVRTVKELPRIRGCIFSNELLDAFPVHLVEMHDELKEVYVGYTNNNFIELFKSVSSLRITNYFNVYLVNIPRGFRTEINLRIKDWLKEIDNILSEGFILTVDYGYTASEYYDRERSKGTLLCYHRHQYNENPYINIGSQDITAHVNFSSLKKWGDELGLKTIGYCPQGTFLVALGIDEVIRELYRNSPDYSSEILKIKGLFLPQGMGESHKVMIQYKGVNTPCLKGFTLRNQLGTL
jgi:SAM-dependent MidA family methyltransferase